MDDPLVGQHGASLSPPSPPPGPAADGADVPALDKRLVGDLPCVVCKYSLKGISIRDACPECGTAVRATILSIVDPYASELRPLPHPLSVAAGLVLWSLGCAAAALLSWLPFAIGIQSYSWRLSLIGALGASALGAALLIRPSKDVKPQHTALALSAVALYIPLLLIAWRLTGPEWIIEMGRYPPLRSAAAGAASTPILLHLFAGVCVIGILAGLRPNARTLVARSLALRMGRVDRQTMLAMMGAVAIGGLGDLLFLLRPALSGPAADILSPISLILVILGASLATIGALGLVIDSLRIARSLLIPTPRLASLIRSGS